MHQNAPNKYFVIVYVVLDIPSLTMILQTYPRNWSDWLETVKKQELPKNKINQ